MMPLYELDNVTFAYPGREVFENLCITLETGHFYGIIGPNGCGKTTLVDLLCGYRHPQSGRILYKSRPMHEYGPKALARQVALVPQNASSRFGFSCKEVVMMGRYPHMPRFSRPSEADMKTVRDVMVRADLLFLSDRSMTELSGGERQRVLFARALAQNTPVLLLDEASANLDMHHTIALLNLAAERINEETAVIAVLQDMNLAALYCDYLLCMTRGQVVVQGPTEKVLTASTINRVFKVNARVAYHPHANALQVAVKR